ncbi:tetratricopeptide repeat protein [Spirosoma litoris]
MKTNNDLLMDNTDELRDWELIEGYYQHTLSTTIKAYVEKRFLTDPEFRANAETWKQADTDLRTLALRNVVRQTIRQESHRLHWAKRIRLGVTALAATCVLTGWGLFSSVDIQTYQQDLTILRQYRTDSSGNASSWTARQQTFYRDFFEGQSYLADGQPALAIPYFERVLNLKNLRPYFRQAVAWQLVNAYLQTNQPDNADATYHRLMATGELVYPIRNVDHLRIKCQIGWQKLVY